MDLLCGRLSTFCTTPNWRARAAFFVWHQPFHLSTNGDPNSSYTTTSTALCVIVISLNIKTPFLLGIIIIPNTHSTSYLAHLGPTVSDHP
jgi:hypothetical protein